VAELWSLYVGLSVAKETGMLAVEVQVDS